MTTKAAAGSASSLPSIQEQGFDLGDISAWTGLPAPKNAPPEVIAKLSELLRDILAEPAAVQRLAEIGFEAQWAAPKEFAERIGADIELWVATTKEAGIERQ